MAFLYTSWKHCYVTALYTTDADYAIHYTCAYKFTARTSVVYGRNAENERIKMADYSELVSMGTL